MVFPVDGNCLFQVCISKLESCSSVTTEQAIIMRYNLMDYLLCHADEPSGYLTSLTWRTLVMMHAPKIQNKMITKGYSWEDPIISTLEHYAYYMRIATEDRCIFGNTPELFLISCRYSLNIAVYQVDPCSPLHYILVQEFVGDFNNLENVVFCSWTAFIISHHQRSKLFW